MTKTLDDLLGLLNSLRSDYSSWNNVSYMYMYIRNYGQFHICICIYETMVNFIYVSTYTCTRVYTYAPYTSCYKDVDLSAPTFMRISLYNHRLKTERSDVIYFQCSAIFLYMNTFSKGRYVQT